MMYKFLFYSLLACTSLFAQKSSDQFLCERLEESESEIICYRNKGGIPRYYRAIIEEKPLNEYLELKMKHTTSRVAFRIMDGEIMIYSSSAFHCFEYKPGNNSFLACSAFNDGRPGEVLFFKKFKKRKTFWGFW